MIIESLYLSQHPFRDATPREPAISLEVVFGTDHIGSLQICGMAHLESADKLNPSERAQRVEYTEKHTWAAI